MVVTRTRGFITRAIVIHHILGSCMLLNYKILNNNRKQQKKPRQFKPALFAGPRGASQPFIRDEETGRILRAPKYLPSGRRSSPTDGLPRNSGTAEVCEKSHWTPIQKPDLAWLQTQFHLQGTSFLPPPPRSLDLSWSDEEARDLKSFWAWVYPFAPEHRYKPKGRPSLPRMGWVIKRPSSSASGSSDQREQQAANYLRQIDHKKAQKFDQPEFTLLKVVCNLRNYFGMNLDQTLMLMKALFNPMGGTLWSREGISLAWDLVADYTPALGIRDVDGIAKQRQLEVEDAVTELLAYTRSGSRVEVNALLEVLNEWNPDLHANSTELGRAVRRITGIKSGASKSKSYYSGFHLPKPHELLDTNHAAALNIGTIKIPLHPLHPASADQPNLTLMWLGLDFSACSIDRVQIQASGASTYMLVNLYRLAS